MHIHDLYFIHAGDLNRGEEDKQENICMYTQITLD